MGIWVRRRLFKKRHCPHVHLQGLYGDVVNFVGGYRLQCVDCWTLLDGPVSLAKAERDPENLMPAREDWYQGKTIGNDLDTDLDNFSSGR